LPSYVNLVYTLILKLTFKTNNPLLFNKLNHLLFFGTGIALSLTNEKQNLIQLKHFSINLIKEVIKHE